MGDTILLYDDDEDVRKICQVVLKKFNHEVKAMRHCTDVIADILLLQPAIILMDVKMPGIGGGAAIQLIQQHKATKHIPVILFSAVTGLETIAAKLNANGFLEKPFDIYDLSIVINNHLLKIKKYLL